MTSPATAPAAIDGPSSQRVRAVVITTLAVGAGLLALALRLERGSPGFYVVTLLVAVAWTLPSFVVRPAAPPNREVWAVEAGVGAAIGAAMFGVFVGGAAIGRHFTFLAHAIDSILRKADGGSVAFVLVVALINGVAEELFFRGALVEALGPLRRRTWIISLALYVVVTAVSGNTALTLAAVVMGAVFVAERWRTGNLLASIATHLVWSTLMLLAFPR